MRTIKAYFNYYENEVYTIAVIVAMSVIITSVLNFTGAI